MTFATDNLHVFGMACPACGGEIVSMEANADDKCLLAKCHECSSTWMMWHTVPGDHLGVVTVQELLSFVNTVQYSRPAAKIWR